MGAVEGTKESPELLKLFPFVSFGFWNWETELTLLVEFGPEGSIKSQAYSE